MCDLPLTVDSFHTTQQHNTQKTRRKTHNSIKTCLIWSKRQDETKIFLNSSGNRKLFEKLRASFRYLQGTELVTISLNSPRTPLQITLCVCVCARRYLFWTEWGQYPRIERSRLDGTQRLVLVNVSISWPNGISIDYEVRTISHIRRAKILLSNLGLAFLCQNGCCLSIIGLIAARILHFFAELKLFF